MRKRDCADVQNSSGLVLGKGKGDLFKLRDDHPGASINFDSKAQEMTIWGESSEVDKVCTQILKKQQPKPHIISHEQPKLTSDSNVLKQKCKTKKQGKQSDQKLKAARDRKRRF